MNKAVEIYSKLIKDDHNRLVLAVDFDKMQKNIDNLQQRIDKSIELIEKYLNREYVITDEYFEHIIQILRGEDNESN